MAATTYQNLKTKKARVAYIKEQITSNVRWLYRALIAVYKNQTSDEQLSQTTKEHNGVGFTGTDAEILTSYAQQYQQRGFLTPKQLAVAQKKMPKYAAQLERNAK